jgi:hypothetical protein
MGRFAGLVLGGGVHEFRIDRLAGRYQRQNSIECHLKRPCEKDHKNKSMAEGPWRECIWEKLCKRKSRKVKFHELLRVVGPGQNLITCNLTIPQRKVMKLSVSRFN